MFMMTATQSMSAHSHARRCRRRRCRRRARVSARETPLECSSRRAPLPATTLSLSRRRCRRRALSFICSGLSNTHWTAYEWVSVCVCVLSYQLQLLSLASRRSLEPTLSLWQFHSMIRWVLSLILSALSRDALVALSLPLARWLLLPAACCPCSFLAQNLQLQFGESERQGVWARGRKNQWERAARRERAVLSFFFVWFVSFCCFFYWLIFHNIQPQAAKSAAAALPALRVCVSEPVYGCVCVCVYRTLGQSQKFPIAYDFPIKMAHNENQR